MDIGSSIRARQKVLGLAYNWCETQDKRLLSRDLDRDWCHCHTTLKLSLSQPMVSMDIGGSIQVCWCSHPWICGLWQRKVYISVAVTPAPVQVPTQQLLVLSFTSVVGQAKKFSPCHTASCSSSVATVWVWSSTLNFVLLLNYQVFYVSMDCLSETF